MDWISKTIGRYLSLGILFLQSTEKYDAGKYLFSCPGQLNIGDLVTHSLTQSVSESGHF